MSVISTPRTKALGNQTYETPRHKAWHCQVESLACSCHTTVDIDSLSGYRR